MESRPDMILPRLRRVIFKAVGDGRPYPDHGYTTPRQWSKVAPRQVRGAYGYYTVSRFYTQGKIHSNNIGLFIQDAWTLNNRLTINAGVRADSETMPSYRPENPSLKFGFGDKIAPRVGFALDSPSCRQTTKVLRGRRCRLLFVFV